MKKTVVVLLFLCSIAVGMEIDEYISEKVLQLSEERSGFVKEISSLSLDQAKGNLSDDPKKFLIVLYNIKGLYVTKAYWGEVISCSSVIQGYNFNGYGSLGVILIAKNLDRGARKSYVYRLLKHCNFLPTKKDLNLAYLDLWEQTQEDSTRKVLLCFGNKDESSILSCLPFDLIKLIAQFIEPAEKPLLPRNFFENGIVKVQSIERKKNE